MDREKQIDLGSWTGLQKAFATVAGSCSAARAQCLKQVRESGMLDDVGLTWEEFCKDYAGLSRPHADSLIRQYEQFGDAYFRLSEIARVSPRTFERIAGRIEDDALEIDGEKAAGRRATNPVSATHLRIHPANSSVCNKPLRKTGNAFPEKPSWTRKNNSTSAPGPKTGITRLTDPI